MLSHHRVETPRGHNGPVLDRRCQGPGHSQGQSNSHGTQNAGLKVEAALYFFFHLLAWRLQLDVFPVLSSLLTATPFRFHGSAKVI